MTTPAETVTAYHRRSKHHLQHYAAGPETLDWSMQPEPFREFAGAVRILLPFVADRLTTPFRELAENVPEAMQFQGLDALSALLELSLGVSAWKQYGPDRWALRCNPSSGNLHPTEGYILSTGCPGLTDGVYHYLSRDHCLEQRLTLPTASAQAGLYLALTSVHWREAWKYGERAFRYCQLDTGHALAAISYAAAALGWQARLMEAWEPQLLAAWLGLDRGADYAGAEAEEPELLLALLPRASGTPLPRVPGLPPATGIWTGQAQRLDPHPMYHWPVIDEVAEATRHRLPEADSGPLPNYPRRTESCPRAAVDIIRGRRSAQRFDPSHTMDGSDFMRMLDALLQRSAPPWDVWDYAPRLHPVIFVHRVTGLPSGLYVLARSPQAEEALRAGLRPDFLWQSVAGAPQHLPLFLLEPGDGRKTARTLCCHQAIAADSCFAVAMLAEFSPLVPNQPSRYRQLHWEAAMLGHILYLQAEAAGLRGTGIGCYFDDALHELLGLQNEDFQSLYHFTVGAPLADNRITTLPPYPDRKLPGNGEGATHEA